MVKLKRLWNTRMKRRSFLKLTGAGVGISGAYAFRAPAFAKERKLTILRGSLFPGPNEDNILLELASEWTKQTGVKVIIDIHPTMTLLAKISKSLVLGAGQDIIQMLHNWPHLYDDQLQDVSKLAEEIGQKCGGYYDAPKKCAVVGNRWRALPFKVLTNIMSYRKDWFDEIGATEFPTTWEEFRAVGKKLKDRGRPYGQALGHSFGDPYVFVYNFLWAMGAKEIADDGNTVALNSAETRKAMDFMVGMWNDAFDPSGLKWDDLSNNQKYFRNEISCTSNGPSIYLAARKRNPDLAKATQHAMYPRGPAGRFHLNIPIQFAIPKYCKNPDVAKEFLLYLLDKPQYTRWMDTTLGYYTSPTRYWEKHPIWDRMPIMNAVRDAGKVGRTMGCAGPPNKASAEVMSNYILVDLFAKCCKGELIDRAIKWAEEEMKKIYGA